MNSHDTTQPPRIFTPEYYARMRDLEATSWWNEGMRDIASDLLTRAELPTDGTLLDAGCGSGQTMSWFKSIHPSWHTIGVDVAGEGLAAAEALDLDVYQATVLQLPFEDHSFDAVMSLDVLQHLPLNGGDRTALLEFARVLRPHGVLLLRTNAQSIPRAAPDERSSFRKYDKATLRAAIESAGFEIQLIGRCNAVLGLAEVPRELAAARRQKAEYHGILAEAANDFPLAHRIKRAWLRFEGRAMAAGMPLPLGRTLFALCRVPS